MAASVFAELFVQDRPKPGDLRAEGRLLKAGRRLAVVEVSVFSENQDEAVAHATGTYSIPPDDRD